MSESNLTHGEALKTMIDALDEYIEAISANMEYMKQAASICTTAMSSDSVSMEMVDKLEGSRKLLEMAVDQAAGLKKDLIYAAEEDIPGIINMIRNS